ncbi:hypothetical protein MauCBS54593_000761 [Microsporum audouinii]
MARRYSQEELLHLRESPLVVKPDGLPPIEEWMGPLQDTSTQKKHATSKEQTNQNESSASAQDIILGPPKTSFSSSTRGFGKFSDPDRYNSLKSPDADGTKSDRFPHRDNKFLKDKDADRDRDPDKRDSKSHITNGRRSGREDKDDWGTRPRRTFGQEDSSDRRVKRDGDRWDSRDFREHRDQQETGNERGHRGEQGKYPNRRDTQTKGRHDHPSWFRDNDAQENAEHEEEKTPVRNREWRRGVQGQDKDRDRDWNRSTKHEQDPEWMDSSNKSDHKEAHTQEDFQRWKERMKTGGAQPSDEMKNKAAPPEVTSVEAKPAETKRTDGEMFSSLEPSYKTDAGFDDFFGPWGGSKSTQEPGTSGSAIVSSSMKEGQAAKPAKSSRFAGFFNATSETATKEVEAAAPQPARPVSTDADQEGFQRILQLLGGNKSRNSTPQAEDMIRPKPTPPQQSQQEFSHVPAPTASPHRDIVNRQPYMGYPEPPREQSSHGPEQLIAQKAPKESQPSPYDADLLLRLMRQAKIGQSHQGQVPAHTPLHNPGIQNMPDMQSRNQEIPKQKSPLFFDDPAIANMQRPDANDPRNQLRRRPTGGPPGYFDEMQYQGPSNGSHTPANPPGLRTQPTVQPTVGIQRPPGLEQVTSPGGWPTPQQMQQGASAQFIGRPGIPNQPPNRSMNPNFPPVPQMPMPGGMPPPNDRQAFQRGPGAGGPANFGPPPGIVPPPGYMTMNHPPPSAFPPMPHTPEAMMGLSHGHPAHFGAGPQQGVGTHQSSSRQLLDMLRGHNGGPGDGGMGNRNGAGMMGPPYR